jgi:sulfite exporter TauE/SafE
MQTTLLWTALVMGLAGGPHCAAMCGAACAGISHRSGKLKVRPLWEFQLGRLLGYACAGAAAAAAMQSLAWVSEQSSILRLAWTLMHVVILAWGLMLLAQARQPVWAETWGRRLWGQVRALSIMRAGPLVTGTLWTFLPCGLLYSALLAAALSGGWMAGALFMALFAAGSSVSLVLAPYLLLRLHDNANRWRQDWGTRLAGLMLAGVAVWALWMDLAPRIALWCAP